MKRISTNCKCLLAPALAAALIMLTACAVGTDSASAAAETPEADAALRSQRQVFAMDTVMFLTAYGPNGETALDAAEAEIYALEEDLDPENETGSVYAANAGAGAPVAVSRDYINIMLTYMSLWEATGGALDPGLYPLIRAWGFTTGDYRVPDQAELDGLLAVKNTAAIALDEGDQMVTVPAGMALSFGAVAKGYTAERVLDIMSAAGVDCAILSLGGNVQTLGDVKPDGSRWQVAVTDPHDTGAYVGMLSVGQTAVVTSGGYQRFFEQDGVTYIHIIDPATGRPVENDLLSVTVVMEDGAMADGLSTSLFVMGAQGALDYYKTAGGFEMVLITTGDHVIITPGLADAFQESGNGYIYEYLE